MTEELQHSRLPEGATHHQVSDRGVQSWIQPYGDAFGAIARVWVKDENGERACLQQGVAVLAEQLQGMTEDQIELRKLSLIAEAKAVIDSALDFIAEHGPKAYREMVEHQELEQNSGSES